MKRDAIGLALVLFFAPAGVSAQDEQHSRGFYSFAIGTQITKPVAHGFIVQASMGRSRPGGAGVQFDVFDEQYEARLLGALETMGVIGMSASIIQTTRNNFYHVVGGPGAYYFYRPPTVQGALRPGLSLGSGLAWPLRHLGQPSFCLEFRFSVIFGRDTQRALGTMTLGIQF